MLSKKLLVLFVLVLVAAMVIGCGSGPYTVEVRDANGTAVVSGNVDLSGVDGGVASAPTAVSTDVPAPPASGVATITIADHPLLEVPEMRGPNGPDVYPELFQDGGCKVEVSGDLFANADDQIWWKAEEADEWTVLTEKVEDYAQIPAGGGWLYVHNVADATHITFLEAMPANSPTVNPTPSAAPPSSSAPLGTLEIDGTILGVPPMAGPYYQAGGQYGAVWSDAGAAIKVSGSVWVQCDDSCQANDGDGNWYDVTANVSEYGRLSEDAKFFRVRNFGGQTYWKIVEVAPAIP